MNAFGRLLLEMCAECDLRILNDACRRTKKDISHNYVCAAGCSSVDYYICSKELADQDIELHVAERFDSKHLPVELSLCAKEDQPNSKEQLFVEKLVWDDDKKSTFVEAVRGEIFQNVITQAKDLLSCSVDEAVNCLNNGLLEAAACMKRRVSKGLKSSKWFDVECKAVSRETRKWWRKFRRSKCEESKRKNRLVYVNCKKSFRSLLKQKRQKYKANKLNILTSKMKD